MILSGKNRHTRTVRVNDNERCVRLVHMLTHTYFMVVVRL